MLIYIYIYIQNYICIHIGLTYIHIYIERVNQRVHFL